MEPTFVSVRFDAAVDDVDRLVALRTARAGDRGPAVPAGGFADDESAARFYLHQLFRSDTSHRGVETLAPDDAPGLVSDLKLAQSHAFQLSGATADHPEEARPRASLLRFDQMSPGWNQRPTYPVFGGGAIVELDSSRRPLAMEADLVPPVKFVDAAAHPSKTKEAALASIAEMTRKPVDELGPVAAARTMYYCKDPEGPPRLAFFFEGVPAAPAEFDGLAAWKSRHKGTALDPPAGLCLPRVNYIVDAINGEVLSYFSAVPFAARSPVEETCHLSGTDELGVVHGFDGRSDGNGAFEMSNPLSGTTTFDLDFKELGSAPALDGCRIPGADLGTDRRAAVSAHVNAQRVFEFFNSVLMHHGIDGAGMGIVSIYNCTVARYGRSPREWGNACWWGGRMWYGQVCDTAKGRLVSFAEHLDIVAHEITHGITEHTAKLEYRDLSGALNESFSDIFGVLINNWYDITKPFGRDATTGRDAVHAGWLWEIGVGLGQGGGPLRDLSCPGRTGDPCHMREYRPQVEDSGGVHRYSAIHNKAAYNVLTARDAGGGPVFSPREVALLYYLALRRLRRPNSNFTDALRALLGAAGTYYSGTPALRQSKLSAIMAAYEQVGILPA